MDAKDSSSAPKDHATKLPKDDSVPEGLIDEEHEELWRGDGEDCQDTKEHSSHAESQEPEHTLNFEGEQISQLQKELDETKDQLLRALAEVENMRRRSAKEKEDAAQYAITKFARDILGVADNLDRALVSVPDGQENEESIRPLYEGVTMTLKDFYNILERHGITIVDALEKQFDPNFHQAMFEVENDAHDPGTCIQQVQKGFKIKDRLLRPALVGVTKAPSKE